MPINEFPFIKASAHSRLRPMLHVRITNPHSGLFMDTIGLIDTGADQCALPAQFADFLGHSLEAGQAKKIGTGNGVTMAYSHTCRIEIFDTAAPQHGQGFVVHTIQDAPIDFMPNLSTVLLGVGNFLGRFTLTIDYPQKTFSICSPAGRIV